MLLLNSNQYKVIDIPIEFKFWLQKIINLSLERFPFKMSIISRQPFLKLVSSKTKKICNLKLQTSKSSSQTSYFTFSIGGIILQRSADVKQATVHVPEIVRLLTAISFTVVQLTHIIHTIIIMLSQSQNVCKYFQTQKNLIRNRHSLEKLLGRLPCSPTMNTLGKEDIWDVGNQQLSITPKSPPSPYSHLCSSF